MFYYGRPMTTARGDVDAAVAGLQARWGAAAPRVIGSMALAPADEPLPDGGSRPAARPDDRVIPTGFAASMPSWDQEACRDPPASPSAATARAAGPPSRSGSSPRPRWPGSVVAWLDLARTFDPVEAVARGVRLEWLVVITPETLDEGLAIAGSLLAGRSVDLLAPRPARRPPRADGPAEHGSPTGSAGSPRSPVAPESLFVVLEPPGLAGGLATAVAESTGLRLELARRSWIRLGRDIVGQRTEALVARNRYGPPGRRATLRILYAEGGERDACLRRDDLLVEAIPTVDQAPAIRPERTDRDATAPPLPAASPPRAGAGARLRALPDGPARAGRPAVGPGAGHRREPATPGRSASGGGCRSGAPIGSPRRRSSSIRILTRTGPRPRPRSRRSPRSARGSPGATDPADASFGLFEVQADGLEPLWGAEPVLVERWPVAGTALPRPLAADAGCRPGPCRLPGRRSPGPASPRPSPRSTPGPATRSSSRPVARPRSSPRTRPASSPRTPTSGPGSPASGCAGSGRSRSSPGSALIARFGEEGARIHARARGEEIDPFRPRRAPERLALAPAHRARGRRTSSRSASSSIGSPAR